MSKKTLYFYVRVTHAVAKWLKVGSRLTRSWQVLVREAHGVNPNASDA